MSHPQVSAGHGPARRRDAAVSSPAGLLAPSTPLPSAAEQRWIRRLVLRAFVLRAVVVLALDLTGLSVRFAPDETTYFSAGHQLARFWSGDAFYLPHLLVADQPTGYIYLNAASIFLFGGVLPLKLLNALLGAFVCYYQFLLSRALFGPAVARRSALLTAFLPSLVLWSALNIRDVWAIFLILYTAWKSYQLKAGYSHLALVQLLGAIALLTTFRQYLFFVVALPPVVGLLLGAGRRVARNFLLASLASLGILMLTQAGMARSSLDLMSLEALAQARQNMTYGAGSAFGEDIDTSTPGQALAYLPIGIAYFLFSPFPWDITSALKVASLPEILFIYWLTPHMVRGAAYSFRHRLGDTAHVLVLVGLLVVSYSLGSGNVGTLYRHRAQALPFMMLLGAVGLEKKRSRTAPGRIRPGQPIGSL